MTRKFELVLLAAALVCASVAATPKFEKVPAAAMKALQGVRGKPVISGLVFANGHYIKPPYRVARLGTAIFVNDEQVSNQIVPWKSFLATHFSLRPRNVSISSCSFVSAFGRALAAARSRAPVSSIASIALSGSCRAGR